MASITGKTLIARQIAKELKGRFLTLKLSDILRGHAGVGEQRIRSVINQLSDSRLIYSCIQ